MQRRRICKRENRRKGFTLIELLVVISIIAVLMSLILPAVQAVRARARAVQCLSRIRQLALATHNWAGGNLSQRLPATNQPAGSFSGNWVIAILPHLDQKGLYERYVNSAAPGTMQSIFLKILICPSDETNDGLDFGCNYVANAGYVGLTGKTSQVNRAHGVFFSGTSISLDRIDDGKQQTIMFSEHIVYCTWSPTTISTSVSPLFGSFREFPTGTAQWQGGQPGGSVATSIALPGTLTSYGNNYPNGRAAQNPSSKHTGVVHAAFCDGSARPISDTINRDVYHALITPNGQRFGQAAVGDNF